MFDECGDVEDEFAGIGVLKLFAIDGEADVETVRVGDFIGGNNRGAKRTKCREALGHGPLGGGELDVPSADVVDDGVAIDVIAPGGGGDAEAAPDTYTLLLFLLF